MQGEEREQPPVRRGQGHRLAVAYGRDLSEELHPQHLLDAIGRSGPRIPALTLR
jgi:hypothetical protein